MADFDHNSGSEEFTFDNAANVRPARNTGLAAVKESLFSPGMRKWTITAIGLVGVVIVLLIKAITANPSSGTKANQKTTPTNAVVNNDIPTTEIGDINEAEREQVLLAKEQYNSKLAANAESSESVQPVFIPAEEVSLVDDGPNVSQESNRIIDTVTAVPEEPIEILPIATERPVQSRREGTSQATKLQNSIMRKLVSRKLKYEPVRFSEPTDNRAGDEGQQKAYVQDAESDSYTLVQPEGVKIIGEMEYVAAQADFGMSTYYPGPAVFSLISSDPILNKAKVSGSMVEYTPPAKNAPPLIQVQLDRMCLADGRCFDIQARAFDPATSRFAISSEIDRHWLIRYGFWGLGTVLNAAGAAVQLGTATTTIQDGVIVQDKTLTARDEVIVGLGILGEEIGSILSQYLYDPPEVKVNQYERCGIYFRRPVILQI